jgi:hypothetical protein
MRLWGCRSWGHSRAIGHAGVALECGLEFAIGLYIAAETRNLRTREPSDSGSPPPSMPASMENQILSPASTQAR